MGEEMIHVQMRRRSKYRWMKRAAIRVMRQRAMHFSTSVHYKNK